MECRNTFDAAQKLAKKLSNEVKHNGSKQTVHWPFLAIRIQTKSFFFDKGRGERHIQHTMKKIMLRRHDFTLAYLSSGSEETSSNRHMPHIRQPKSCE